MGQNHPPGFHRKPNSDGLADSTMLLGYRFALELVIEGRFVQENCRVPSNLREIV